MADVLTKLKIGMPNLESVFYRQDNAGCYHCASTIVGAKVVADKAGVTLKRMDFSDPQGGKGACDRKAATIKSHMQIYLNEGNDIENAAQMKAAIESFGGVPGVVYESDCLRVWRAYGIGQGKLIPWSKFQVTDSDSERHLIVDIGTDNERSTHLPFVDLKPRKVKCPAEDTSSDGDDDGSASDEGNANSGLFSCLEEGSIMTYQRYSSLEQHLQCGKHKRALEQETLLDRAMLRYAYELEKGGSKVEELGDVACLGKDSSCDAQNPPMSMGWAIKSSFVGKRLAAKRSVDVVTEEDEEEEICVRHEEALSEMRRDVSNLVALQHPIMHDTYNICELASSGKLAATFRVTVLRDICIFLGIDVSNVTITRKKPYIDKLQEVVKSCTCYK
ncbi:hypothetical protein ACROYT_G001862 [Oculina patagonica]